MIFCKAIVQTYFDSWTYPGRKHFNTMVPSVLVRCRLSSGTLDQIHVLMLFDFFRKPRNLPASSRTSFLAPNHASNFRDIPYIPFLCAFTNDIDFFPCIASV